ncbi:MAG: NAD-binding protein [Dehalococcoidia bacterium]|nr:MAG: NAD-binding protein [Dehalococcoidia bacterium]
MKRLTPWRRLAIGGTAALIVWAVGIVGYMTIEGFSFLEAVYQTITAVTTAGFGEINPLGSAGRIFTIVIIILGVIVILYVLTAVMQIAVEGELENVLGVRRMKGKIEALHDHYILCGFGRVGEEIVRDFIARDVPFVIVDSNPEAIERARKHDYLLLEGDATSDAVLIEAGIQRAYCLLAASDSDSGNTYIVLTAKALNPRLFVVARVGQPASTTPMLRAGADRVISPYSIGGRRMALSALQPLMVDFIDTLATGRHGEQILAELEASKESGLAGMTIEGCFQSCPGATVLALQKSSGAIQVGPRGATVLELGDRLIVLGDEAELECLRPPSLAEPAEQATPERT